jgi:hypothetical protein
MALLESVNLAQSISGFFMIRIGIEVVPPFQHCIQKGDQIHSFHPLFGHTDGLMSARYNWPLG